MPNSFLRFLNFAHAVKDATPQWPVLDAVEERLLLRFAGTWFKRGPISIIDAMKLLNDVSVGTAHTKVNSLIKKGILKVEQDEKDKRIKRLAPTQLTIDYFTKLDDYMIS